MGSGGGDFAGEKKMKKTMQNICFSKLLPRAGLRPGRKNDRTDFSGKSWEIFRAVESRQATVPEKRKEMRARGKIADGREMGGEGERGGTKFPSSFPSGRRD